MNENAADNDISIRELQRNAADVMSRVERGACFTIRRRGRVVGRLLPPDPEQEAIDRAVAEGVLDPEALTSARTAADLPRIRREPTPEPGASPLSDALAKLREAER